MNSNPLCPLSLSDVQSYIRSKGADDIIGTQHNGATTLIAEVWYHTHGVGRMAVVRGTGKLEVGSDRYELSDVLWAIHLLFERIPHGGPKITAQQWIQHAALYWYKTIKATKGLVVE